MPLGTTNLYVDDCIIYHADYNVNEINCNVKKYIDDVEKWYSCNGLVPYVVKCITMLIGLPHFYSHGPIALKIHLNN